MSYPCPNCKSIAYKRNGYTRHGKQNHRCLDCGRQFCFHIPTSSINVKENSLGIIVQRFEAEEFWGAEEKNLDRQVLWIALDAQIKQPIAYQVETQQEQNGLKKLWNLIPQNYQLNAKIYTNQENIFKASLPEISNSRLSLLKDYG